MQKPILFGFLFPIILLSCTPTSEPVIKQAEWLIGEWQQNSPDENFTEIWGKVNDSVFSAISFSMNGADTAFTESIILKQSEGELLYIPTITSQNDGQPVVFTSTRITADSLVFDNPGHDFPQKITYTRISADSLLATISGTINGENRFREFPMVRKISHKNKQR
jgi:hypothetical protein